MTVQVGGAESYNHSTPSGDPAFPEHLINGLSPNGTTINLFDYWLTGQDDTDSTDPQDIVNVGINKGHALLFFRNSPGGSWNSWTSAGGDVRQGIVKNELVNGYPQLDVDTSTVSLLKDRDGQESLAYLFDPSISSDGKASYTNVGGLLQVDDQGYYYYNSQENYATYYENTNSFALYECPGIIPGGTSPVGQFFPFNEATADAVSQNVGGKIYKLMSTKKSTDTSINHYFGMHMSTRFIQQNGGYTAPQDTPGSLPVTYEFSGDDDVWIYIDGKLVGDLGGIHDAASIKIDFSTGDVVVTGAGKQQHTSTLKELFGLSGDTFADGTYHTLDFFYLERGNVDSNMYLKYNLVTIPESDLIKVDQLGNAVSGAEFTLYGAEDYQTDGENAQPIATGTTDGNGQFVFLTPTSDGGTRPISIQELYEEYKNQKDHEGNNLVLVETSTPEGYRTTRDVGLYFKTNDAGDEVMLLTGENSIWGGGAYAMPKVTATAKNKIQLLEDPTDIDGSTAETTVDLVGDSREEDPLMFAVVFQKQEDGTWHPVSGDPLKGWTVYGDGNLQSVLEAAKANPYLFTLGSSGAYQVEISNLPGDVMTYYHFTKREEDAKYTIGYYYTTADSLNDATSENTRRINADPTNADDAEKYGFDRIFSANLYVTNMKNRLLVQKVDDEGSPVDDVQFSLYKASEVTVGPDGEVTPNEDASPAVVTTGTVSTPISLEGAGVFPTGNNVLPNGEYWLFETLAPTGYKAKTDPVHVIVDNTGVYADAGEEYDGVTVLRGVGSVAKSMLQFAVDDGVDVTLRDIKAALATSVQYKGYSEDGSFDVSGNGINWGSSSDDVLHLKYANSNKMLDYGLQDSTGGSTLDDLTLSTDVGWSKLLIRQDYNEDDADSTLKMYLGDRDITNLFSGTVTVRVANDRTGNLKISKQVTGEGASQDQDFTFDVTLNKGNAPLTGQYETLKGSTRSTITFDENGKTTLSLKAGESLTILGLPTGASYTVKEQNVPAGYDPSIAVNGDTGSTVNDGDCSATGTIQHNTTEDSAVEVTCTNDFDGSTVLQLKGEKILRGKNITAGDSFTFELTFGDEETSTAIDAGAIVMPGQTSVTVPGDGTSESANFAFGDIRFKTEGTYTFNITEQLPEGTDGQSTSNGDVWYDTHTTRVSVEVTRDGETGLLSAVPTYDNSENPDSSANTDQAKFVNRYAGIKITKKVSGAMGDKDKDFNFNITVTDSNGSPLTGSYPRTINGTESTLDLDEKGPGTFQLKDAETIIIYGLPVGSTCKVEESNAKEDGYTTTVTVGDDVQQNTYQATATLSGDKTIEITFENSRDDVPATGISIDSWPWVLAAAIVVVSGIALIRITRRGSRGGGHFAA